MACSAWATFSPSANTQPTGSSATAFRRSSPNAAMLANSSASDASPAQISSARTIAAAALTIAVASGVFSSADMRRGFPTIDERTRPFAASFASAAPEGDIPLICESCNALARYTSPTVSYPARASMETRIPLATLLRSETGRLPASASASGPNIRSTADCTPSTTADGGFRALWAARESAARRSTWAAASEDDMAQGPGWNVPGNASVTLAAKAGSSSALAASSAGMGASSSASNARLRMRRAVSEPSASSIPWHAALPRSAACRDEKTRRMPLACTCASSISLRRRPHSSLAASSSPSASCMSCT